MLVVVLLPVLSELVIVVSVVVVIVVVVFVVVGEGFVLLELVVFVLVVVIGVGVAFVDVVVVVIVVVVSVWLVLVGFVDVGVACLGAMGLVLSVPSFAGGVVVVSVGGVWWECRCLWCAVFLGSVDRYNTGAVSRDVVVFVFSCRPVVCSPARRLVRRLLEVVVVGLAVEVWGRMRLLPCSPRPR